MNILITGAAGNLGGFLARDMLGGPHRLKLMTHRTELAPDLAAAPNTEVLRCDLDRPDTLVPACQDTDAIVHFAGVLFAPGPERFLPHTNVEYVRNLARVAVAHGVRKLILVSFPHVEGESTVEHPAAGKPEGEPPTSVHARTRLAAEHVIRETCEGTDTTPVLLRPGMIYGREVLMIAAARWCAEHHLLAVWRKPTQIHLISLPDFNACVRAAVEDEAVSGIYNLGDDAPTTLQRFLDTACRHWGCARPWRFPRFLFFVAAWCVETYARIFRTKAPLTRDFIRIGMQSYVMDTSRMKAELRAELTHPRLENGLDLL